MVSAIRLPLVALKQTENQFLQEKARPNGLAFFCCPDKDHTMAPREFLRAITKENVGMRAEEMVSVFFTLAAELCLAYPAQAAGQIDWEAVANDMLRGNSGPRQPSTGYPGDSPQEHECATIRDQALYLREAAQLRPDPFIPGQTVLTGFEERQS